MKMLPENPELAKSLASIAGRYFAHQYAVRLAEASPQKPRVEDVEEQLYPIFNEVFASEDWFTLSCVVKHLCGPPA